ncbi:MAG TPA: transposase [Haliangiales bacterium]|nr:transposase [Haliangiales bacterium]
MRRRAHRQLALPRPPTWGGPRENSGRKPTGQFGYDHRGRPQPGVSHRLRPELNPRHPLHVTLRAVNGSPSMRNLAVAREIGKLLKRRARHELPCRVVHFTIQKDHIHMIVEAEERTALSRGIQGLASGIARVVNRTTGCAGQLWRDRYHARPLRTPTQVRNCLIYVLRNGVKHGSTAFAVDPCSSAAWFDGFDGQPPARTDWAPVVPPRTWLLATGWRARGGGEIRAGEAPAPVHDGPTGASAGTRRAVNQEPARSRGSAGWPGA